MEPDGVSAYYPLMAILRAGYAALALKLQETMDSGDALSANDIRSRLSDAINDAHRGTGKWAYYIDHFGDGESGDVIYYCDGDTCRTSYEIIDTAGAAKCTIDMENAEDVVPRTVYETEADEEEHYAAMEESYKANGYGSMPLYERFISKKERDAASPDDFAGKGKSYPILKPDDVMAAARSIGRAGGDNKGPSGIKASIIRIAKRKGWEKYLPKAWQGDSSDGKSTESASAQRGSLRINESAAFPVAIQLREAFAPGRLVKIIAPGKGSTAYYTAEALKRAVQDNIFHEGVPMRIDHPTKAEEAARPEGSVKDWGAVLASNAVYRDDRPEGPGIYAPIKTFSDHEKLIEEKGPYAGVSVRAWGEPVLENGKPLMREGVPVLSHFTVAEGTDMVTQAGAGGMFLQESARTEEGEGMTEVEAKRLIEAAVAPFKQRAMRGDAREECTRLLESVSLPQVAKTRIIERSLANLPTNAEGDLDIDKLREAVVRESQSEGQYIASLTGGGHVFGMGVAAPQPPKPEEIAAREATAKAIEADAISVFEAITGNRKVAEIAAKGRAA